MALRDVDPKNFAAWLAATIALLSVIFGTKLALGGELVDLGHGVASPAVVSESPVLVTAGHVLRACDNCGRHDYQGYFFELQDIAVITSEAVHEPAGLSDLSPSPGDALFLVTPSGTRETKILRFC